MGSGGGTRTAKELTHYKKTDTLCLDLLEECGEW